MLLGALQVLLISNSVATYAITAVYPNLSLNCFLMGTLLKLIADPLNTLLHMISVLFTLYNKRLQGFFKYSVYFY